MLRYVVDEILSKSFDYFLKDKSGISSRSNETTTIGQAQSNTNSNRSEKTIRKANSPPLRGLFSRSSRRRKASPKLLPGESRSNENSFYDELDWFREFRKGSY